MISSALHCANPVMAANLRRVLAPLHALKACPGVEAALLRLHQPLLFRALAAANAGVRRNAIDMLVEVFPLTVRTMV